MGDEPPIERLAGVEPLADDSELEGAGVTKLSGKARQGMPAQRDTQLDLRNGEPCSFSGDTKVAASGDDGAAADSEAVHGGDADLIEAIDGIRGAAADSRRVTQLELVVRPGAAPLAGVSAGGKAGAFAGEDNDTGIKVGRQVVTELLEILVQLTVHRVALIGAVEEGGHDRAFPLDNQRLECHGSLLGASKGLSGVPKSNGRAANGAKHELRGRKMPVERTRSLCGVGSQKGATMRAINMLGRRKQ